MRAPATAAVALLLALTACAGGEAAPSTPAPSSPDAPRTSAPAAADPTATTIGTTTPEDTVTPQQRSAGWWRPEPGTPWQWQLSGDLDLSVDVPVYDVDYQVPREVVDRLHAQGRRVICYVSAGTVEEYRDDAHRFPDEVVGNVLGDWPDERWLDVRRLDVIGPVLLERLDVCRAKGFDAVEPDNVDAWANDSGFDLTGEDQLRFNRWLAAAAHERGMGVALKNDLDQVPELVGDFDFAVNESCARYEECDALQPFVDAGKAVLHVEYGLTPAEFCEVGHRPGFSSMLKEGDLTAYRYVCDHG
ncbi:endo alpha-1,4 polygalactosaminidase [Kineococcus sp. SYSU DK005]|uniref:endo alpha-1,4 polygalactosaminidase n=1 Tax=Kineococcus sp. SYSU DK005 TaxID=3383126 RepID=UPI003D7C442D